MSRPGHGSSLEDGSPAAAPLRLAILGFGQVARTLCELLAEGHGNGRHGGRQLRVVAAASRRLGVLVNSDGLDPAALLSDSGGWPPRPAGWDGRDFAAQVPADILIELTTLDPASGEPATSHCRAALTSGKHVVTANKGPIAWAYQELRDLAAAVGRELLFEATVMDGAPVFSLHRHCLRGCRVTRVRGILNSTTNVILDEMRAGRGFDEAVREAQSMGIAEADPAFDVDGYDAAVKLCALVNVLMGAPLRLPEVRRHGIRGITTQDLAAATTTGTCIKLVAEARLDEDGSVEAVVQPLPVMLTDPFARTSGTSSILTISTDLLGDLTITEEAPGLRQTAYGVLADLLSLASAP